MDALRSEFDRPASEEECFAQACGRALLHQASDIGIDADLAMEWAFPRSPDPKPGLISIEESVPSYNTDHDPISSRYLDNTVANIRAVHSSIKLYLSVSDLPLGGLRQRTRDGGNRSEQQWHQLDRDGDNLAGWLELVHFGTLTIDGTEDSDGDGQSDLDEFITGHVPHAYDSHVAPLPHRPLVVPTWIERTEFQPTTLPALRGAPSRHLRNPKHLQPGEIPCEIRSRPTSHHREIPREASARS